MAGRIFVEAEREHWDEYLFLVFISVHTKSVVIVNKPMHGVVLHEPLTFDTTSNDTNVKKDPTYPSPIL